MSANSKGARDSDAKKSGAKRGISRGPAENPPSEVKQPPSIAEEYGLRWQEHIPLLFTLFATIATLLNLLASAEWYPPLALAILNERGTTNVLVGAFLAILPNFLSTFTWLAIAAPGYWAMRARRAPSVRQVIIGLLGIVFGILALAGWQLLVAAFALVLGFWFGYYDRSNPATGPNSNKRLIASLLAGNLTLVLMSSQLWLPQENLTLKSGEHFTGYVLKEDGPDLVVLRGSPRRIAYLFDAELRQRELCVSTTSRWFRTIPQIFNPRPEPPCTS